MLSHKPYGLTPNVTRYNVLMTNFLEVSGNFLKKKLSIWLIKDEKDGT